MLSLFALLLAIDFSQQVHPIFLAKCMGCHSARMAQGGLALETRAQVLKVVTPGNVSGSVLMKRVTGEVGPRMPLNSPPLSATEIETLKQWIKEGERDRRVGKHRLGGHRCR